MQSKNTVKKPAKKKPAANNSKANTQNRANPRSNTKARHNIAEKNQMKMKPYENPLAVYAIQFIMGLAAVYILISFIIHGVNDVGGIGVFLRNIFYGLLGNAAFLTPFFLGSIAFFLRRDLESGFIKYRVIFTVSCLILYASILHLSSKESTEVGFSANEMFENGKMYIGGGVFGGFFSEILRKSIGLIGAWIFILPLSFIFSIFLFGRTPLDLIRAVVKLVRDYNAAQLKNAEHRVIVKKENRENRDRRIKPQRQPERIREIPASPMLNRNNYQANTNIKAEDFKEFDIDDIDDIHDTDDTDKRNDINDINNDINDNNFDDFDSIETETFEEIPTEKNKKRLIDINPFDKIDMNVKNVEPVMIPNKEIFQNIPVSNADANAPNTQNIKEDSSASKNFKDIQNIHDIHDIENIKESKNSKDSGDSGLNDIFNIIDDEVVPSKTQEKIQKPEINLTNLQVMESAPQIREDEPEPETKSIAFETSQIFGNEKAAPKKEYKIPPTSYLTKDTSLANVDYSEELRTTADKLITTLASFGVKTKSIGCSRGPTITRYEIAPDSGTKVRSITNLVDDIALNLATGGVRIEAPIPGKAAVGIEVPNKTVETVHLRTLLEETQFKNAASRITVALGQDVAGNSIYSDIAKMPHLLIAGATGMGKSICMNSIITSILYKAKPNEVKLMLIDPKKVELNIYNGIPHLLVPVVSDPKKAAGSLAWAVNEMENRYTLIEEKSVRDLKGYNEAVANDPLSEPLSQIVIIIDELADLMMTAPADVEQSICRIAQKARAAGMHLIIATQRPSADVITGLIKANIPSRIAFTVSSQINSSIILDSGGAEKLIGRGDMLYLPVGAAKPMRVQGAYVNEKDVLNVVEFWKKQSDGEYDQAILDEIEQEAARTNTKGAKMQSKDDGFNADDEIRKDSALKPAIEIAIDTGRISTSLLQTKLSLGYARAARIINTMEKMNVIGPFEGSKPRKVLITREEFIEMSMNNELE